MPVVYTSKIREKLRSINLNLLKTELNMLGYNFIRDGAFTESMEPFKHCNYLFYQHPKYNIQIRIGYDYGVGKTKENSYDLIFEICYSDPCESSWRDVTPDFRKNKWRKISCKYINS